MSASRNGLVDLNTQGWALSAAFKRADLRAMLGRQCAADDFVGIDRTLFEALMDSPGGFDPLAFSEAIGDKGRQRLLEIEGQFMQMPDAQTFARWVASLRAVAEKRQMARALELATRRIGGEPVEAVTGDLLQQMGDIRARALGETLIPLSAAVERVRALIARWQSGQEHAETVPTGFADLDRVLGGLERKHIATLGGRPGMGKSQLALQIARNVALWAQGQERDSAVIVFSAEMTVERLVLRLASAATGVSARSIRQGRTSEREAAAYQGALDALAGLPIRIDETPGPTTSQMLNRVAFEALRHAGGIDLVVFDYLELAGEQDEKEDARIGQIVRGLKLIAKRFNCPVLALSQLNREVEKRPGRIPQLSDLRASGWIEALSQQVLLIMRPDAYAARDPQSGRLAYENATLEEMARRLGEGAALVEIPKNRDGETGRVVLRFRPGSTQFAERLTPQPPLHEWRGGVERSEIGVRPGASDSLEEARRRIEQKEQAGKLPGRTDPTA